MGNQIKSDGLHTTTGKMRWHPVEINIIKIKNKENNCFELFIRSEILIVFILKLQIIKRYTYMSFKRYTIRKRKKKTSPIFFRPFFMKKKLKYDVIFTDSVKFIYPYNDGPIHRLFGVTFGIFDTCVSFFGWTINKDEVDIYACIKDDGLFINHKLITIQTNSSYCFQIKCYDESFTYSIFDSENIILCYKKIKNLHSKNIGIENFIEIHKNATVFRSVDFFIQRKG